MDRNVKIAKQLIKIAKSLVATEQDDPYSEYFNPNAPMFDSCNLIVGANQIYIELHPNERVNMAMNGYEIIERYWDKYTQEIEKIRSGIENAFAEDGYVVDSTGMMVTALFAINNETNKKRRIYIEKSSHRTNFPEESDIIVSIGKKSLDSFHDEISFNEFLSKKCVKLISKALRKLGLNKIKTLNTAQAMMGRQHYDMEDPTA